MKSLGGKVYFQETQAFRQWWLWLIILVSTLPLPAILAVQVIGGHPVGDRPVSNLALAILSLVIPVPIIPCFYLAKLKTIIDEEGIHFGWNIPGMEMNHVSWPEIESFSVIDYSFLGYGYRMSGKYGTVYNVNGNKGLLITERDGSKFLIGTARAGEMEEALEKIPQV